MTGNLSVQAEGDFFDFLKNINLDDLAAEINKAEASTPATQPKKDTQAADQKTAEKKDAQSLGLATKDTKTLFIEPLVAAATPEKSETLSLPLPKQNAFNAIMGLFAQDLEELTIKVNSLRESDIKDEFLKLPYNKKVAEIIAMYEVLKEVDDKFESKYLNIFYLNIEANNKLRQKIFDVHEKIKKHNNAIIVTREAVGEKLVKYATTPELKLPEFAAPLAARKRGEKKEKTAVSPTQKKAVLDPTLIKNLNEFKTTLVQDVFPISDELAKMKESPEFKAEVEKKKQEIEQQINEATQRSSGDTWVPSWRRKGRYSQAQPRRYYDDYSPRHYGREASRWTAAPPSESGSSYAQSFPSRPDTPSKTDTQPADSTITGTAPSETSTSTSKEPTMYGSGSSLSQTELDAKKRVENIYQDISEAMETLVKDPAGQTQQKFKDLAQKIENKKTAFESIDRKKQRNLKKPDDLSTQYESFVGPMAHALGKVLDVQGDAPIISTIFAELESEIGDKSIKKALTDSLTKNFINPTKKALNTYKNLKGKPSKAPTEQLETTLKKHADELKASQEMFEKVKDKSIFSEKVPEAITTFASLIKQIPSLTKTEPSELAKTKAVLSAEPTEETTAKE